MFGHPVVIIAIAAAVIKLYVVVAMPRWGLDGKNIVITGGSQGIGKAIVEELSTLGANIITCCRNNETLECCLKDWAAAGYKGISGCVADVSTIGGRVTLVNAVNERFGDTLDGLINNVGSNVRKPTKDYTHDDYQKVMSTNLESAFFLSTSLYQHLKNSRRGSIVNVGSVAGGCSISIKSGVVYGMTKAAMNQMTYNLACEWAGDGIRVNAVCPWYISTPLAQAVLSNPEYMSTVVNRTPLRRIGTVEEVSAAVAFFCMDASSYITGQHITVDGGFSRNGFW